MPGTILVADDERGLRQMLGVLLRRAGYDVTLVGGCQAAAEELAAKPARFDVVITDLAMPDGSGMLVLEAAAQSDESIQVIMITAYATTSQAVQAMRQGAYDYIQKPFKNDELLAVVEKAIEKRTIVEQNRALRAYVSAGFRAGALVGRNPALQRVMNMVGRVASAPASVLITGESGTGKELVARALHEQSSRADKPFVVVNCGALPEALMESELFGHEKGAFTGATGAKEGLFRAAHQGTLFLDEVGELPPSLQVKLLRALQERKVRPVGSHSEVAVEVRVVAATNRDIKRAVADGEFRQDLYYRLNVIDLHLPPLAERPEDIPLLAEHFLQKHSALQNKRLGVSQPAMRWLLSRRYPGNVRELENIIERAVTLAAGPEIEMADLPAGASVPPPGLPRALIPGSDFDLDAHLGAVERHYLLEALQRTGGVRSAAARLLGVSFRSMRYRLAKYGFNESDPEEREPSDAPKA